ncbi:T9SS type A sorting domain-containing protein [Pontibacter cellulosilyticus]|uniref:T9SS type A sorting domain-containing protein n=1 Tax=Pontibacter cellulosilyticus TaxID=1720253 RepID=A0A923N6V0_9BACT|nr:T9SS type A sorting domain-containing protein [Pontibacter cellulosilyticus]MBC5992506.1 T9SS type A sorting domain-containing protein [Pontibacter cellulosilyticus]
MRDALKLSFCLLVILITFLITTGELSAQTPGLIFKPAANGGNKILDPNGDGYVSKAATGFTGTNDETTNNSEIPYRPFPTMATEVVGDLVTGTSGGHTDLVPSQSSGGTGSPIAAYYDGKNLMFRVRLGKQSTASKGYSIMIDSNNLFGNLVSGTTPSSTPNPGFEYEIVLAANFDVSLYDHRNQPNGGSKIWTGSTDQYFQKSIAASKASGDDDYFYDFYLPLTAFAGGITADTRLRMTGITITSAQSGITGTVSDVGGVNFSGTYGGEARNAWADVINSFPSVSLNELMNGGFPSTTILARPPIISSTIFTSSTSISGTSVEAAGSVIRLYQNGTLICGGTLACPTVSSTGTWTLSGIPFGTLIGGAQITATVLAPGKPESVASVAVNVISLASFCTATVPPTITGVSNGSIKSLAGTTQYPGQQVIKVYQNGGTTSVATHTVTAVGTAAPYTWELSTALDAGMWAVTTTPTGQCESFKSNEVCYNGNGQSTFNSTTVTITSVTYPDLTTSTGPSIKNSITTIFGTVSKTGDAVYIFKNGERMMSYTVIPTTINWQINISSLALSTGDVITARTVEAGTKNGSYSCGDLASSRSNFFTVTAVTSAPTIAGSFCTTGSITSVSGACKEPAGTLVQLYDAVSNAVIGSPATVNASGAWTVNTTIANGISFYARATADGKSISSASSTVTLRSPESNTGLAITSVPVIEGATTLSGTVANGTGKIVTLYIGGSPYGTTTATNGSWSFSGISPLELYSGADLYVTVKTSTSCESAPSPVVFVQCKQPLTTFIVTSSIVSPAKACYNSTVTLKLGGSENGVIYNMYVYANGVYTRTGSSVLGTGSTISLASGPMTVDPTTLQVKATKVGSVNCEPNVGSAVTVGVYPQVPNTYDITASTTSGCPGLSTTVTVINAATGYSYQLYNITTSTFLGTAIEPTTAGSIAFPPITVHTTADYSVYIKSVSTQCGTENVNSKFVRITIAGPTVTQQVTQTATKVCSGGSVSFSFDGYTGSTYSLIDKATNTQVGSGIAGSTGTKVSLSTGALNTLGIKNYRIRVVDSSCTSFLVTEPTVEVTNGIPATVSAGSNVTVCGNKYTLQGSDPSPGTGTWSQTSGPAGATIVSINSANSDITGLTSGTYQFTWTVTSNCGTPTSSSSTVTITVNCAAIYSVKSTKYVNEYMQGEVLATVSDEDGGIKSVAFVSGTLPRGSTLNNATGEIKITDVSMLQAGNYIFTVRTVDAYDKTTDLTVGIRMLSINGSSEPLPYAVELSNFTALYADYKVKLQWTTASEDNNNFFEIEKSINGKDFKEIGTVKGNGTTKQAVRYTFTDSHPTSGTIYYRLKQVDFDGKYSYSKTVAVSVKANTKAAVQAYPNPFSKDLTLMLALEEAGDVQIQLLDLQGKVVYSSKTVTEKGFQETTLPLHTLSKGVYILRVNGTGLNQILKVVKAH